MKPNIIRQKIQDKIGQPVAYHFSGRVTVVAIRCGSKITVTAAA